MERSFPSLFTPMRIRGVYFRNRLMAAPIGAWTFSPDNYIFDYALEHFRQKAVGGACAVTVGHTEVNYRESDTDRFGLYFDLRKREGTGALSEFASAVRRHGAHVSLELNYGGSPTMGSKLAGQECFAPVGYVREDGLVVHEITPEKMDEIIGQYAACARKLKLCGFDMVMIHGAHGWLPAQFAAPENTRTDEYGGCLENRLRFPVRLAREIREAVGEDMIIEYRISGCEPDKAPDLFREEVALVKDLEPYIDLIHVSSGGGGGPEGFLHTFPTYLDPLGVNIRAAAALKAQVDIPVVVVGSITTPELADRIIAEGSADFVAMGRPLLADPGLPRKARCGRSDEIRPCIGCYRCLDELHRDHLISCAVNPRTGHERGEPAPAPAAEKLRVVVIGGGPGGMQAAITARERGHKVIPFEREETLGGLLNLCAGDPVKARLYALRNYLVRQTEASGAEIRLGTEASPALVRREKPDAVIVACGAEPRRTEILIEPGAAVFDCFSLGGGDFSGKRVVVVGGNMTGCETALRLLSQGAAQATILASGDRLHKDAEGILGANMDMHLRKAGAEILTGCRCTEITRTDVLYRTGDGTPGRLAADAAVLATGLAPAADGPERFIACAARVIPLGDCVTPGGVHQALSAAYYAAADL